MPARAPAAVPTQTTQHSGSCAQQCSQLAAGRVFAADALQAMRMEFVNTLLVIAAALCLGILLTCVLCCRRPLLLCAAIAQHASG